MKKRFDIVKNVKLQIKKMDRRDTIKNFLEKIVVNAGVGRLSGQPHFNDKLLPQILKDLAAITGQHPETSTARKSVAGFKVREGQIVGLKVTLRRSKMVDFFERLTRIVLPRVRDFSGLSLKNVDEAGILNIGIKEHAVFSEIDPEHSPLSISLGINIVPKGRKRDKAVNWYREMGVPLKKESKESKK